MTFLRRWPISFWCYHFVAVGRFVIAALSLIRDGFSATVALAFLVALATGGGCVSAYQES